MIRDVLSYSAMFLLLPVLYVSFYFLNIISDVWPRDPGEGIGRQPDEDLSA